MPSDEELRKVAEDMRALARSLARDFWEGTHGGPGWRGYPSDAFRKGIRNAVHTARSEFRHGMRYGWGPPGRGYGPPPAGWPTDPGGGRSGPGSAGPGDGSAGPSAGSAGAAGDSADPLGGSAGPGAGWGPGCWGYPRGYTAYPRADRGYPPGRGHGGPPWGQPGWWSPGFPYRPRRPERRRRTPPPVRRKWDASLLAGALGVVFGVAWLLTGLGAVHLATEAVLAVGLMLLGACLIVTARTDWSLSRHGWPVLLGLLMVLGLFATSASFGVTGALSHLSFGNMHSRPGSGGTVYGGFGQLTVDAGQLQPGDTLRVQSIAGETRVNLPPGETAVVQGRVLAGQVCVDGHSYASGVGASSPAVQVPPPGENQLLPSAERPVTIYVHQLAGQVVIGLPGCHSS